MQIVKISNGLVGCKWNLDHLPDEMAGDTTVHTLTSDQEVLGVDVGWSFDGTNYTPNPIHLYGSEITVLAYRTRWTIQEQALLDFISIDDPTASMAVRLQKATLRQIQVNLACATVVDLQDERVRAGAVAVLQALNTASSSTVPDVNARAAVILDTPVAYSELPDSKKSLYGQP